MRTDIASWITGLMRENYEAVGFIPGTTVAHRYIRQNRYILQADEAGKPVGYLLHGAIQCGRPVVVSQHCIDIDKRLRGYGEKAFREFLERCHHGGASSIHLRVADDLPSVEFWRNCGFRSINLLPGGLSRQRTINEMTYLLELPLIV